MRKKCDEYAKKYKLNFSLIATPAEGLSGRFVKIDKQKYGEIEGVTDRDFYTNSFHIPVYYPISIFEKIKKEAPYNALTNGGHITYVEVDGDIAKNPEAFEQIIRCMHDEGIGYGSVNHPVDRDPVCGYNGIIDNVCPRCGRSEDEVKFERIRRITGYLVGTVDRFNNAKQAEVLERYGHHYINDVLYRFDQRCELVNKAFAEIVKKKQEENAMAQQMNTMMNVMPIMSVVMCFSMQIVLGIYWIVSNLLTLLQNVMVKRSKEVNEKI